MDVIFYLLPLAILLAIFFLASFIFAVRDGQFDDLDTPAYRILLDEQQGGYDNGEQK